MHLEKKEKGKKRKRTGKEKKEERCSVPASAPQ